MYEFFLHNLFLGGDKKKTAFIKVNEGVVVFKWLRNAWKNLGIDMNERHVRKDEASVEGQRCGWKHAACRK